jgi:hypothetical protein
MGKGEIDPGITRYGVTENVPSSAMLAGGKLGGKFAAPPGTALFAHVFLARAERSSFA